MAAADGPVPYRLTMAAALLTGLAVRTRCAAVTDHVAAGASELFTWHPERIPAVADYAATTIRERYPDLNVPYHSRWPATSKAAVTASWTAGRSCANAAGFPARLTARSARIGIDLVIPSVLLDAGAGPTGATAIRPATCC
ncbi:DUF1688 family protein [Cupriavidus basilensis]